MTSSLDFFLLLTLSIYFLNHPTVCRGSFYCIQSFVDIFFGKTLSWLACIISWTRLVRSEGENFLDITFDNTVINVTVLT